MLDYGREGVLCCVTLHSVNAVKWQDYVTVNK